MRGSAMKDKRLIYQGDPCTMRLDTTEIQTLEDLMASGVRYCRYYADRRECAAPRYGCVQVAGLKVARYVLLFYPEASERTLAAEVEEFRKRAPLPPEQVEAYIDTPQYLFRRVADPQLVVERVSEYARAVLDLKPGERVFRSEEETAPPKEELRLRAPAEEKRQVA
ncbi:MAG: hypothetical protein HY686_06340 [Chloroflexi bacterium]|nr:hypothetical protein [Chloroflexota bacterium]